MASPENTLLLLSERGGMDVECGVASGRLVGVAAGDGARAEPTMPANTAPTAAGDNTTSHMHSRAVLEIVYEKREVGPWVSDGRTDRRSKAGRSEIAFDLRSVDRPAERPAPRLGEVRRGEPAVISPLAGQVLIVSGGESEGECVG